MNASTETHLPAFSRGECASRQAWERTRVDYSQFLDALGELGLRLPSFDYETADEDLKRGYDNFGSTCSVSAGLTPRAPTTIGAVSACSRGSGPHGSRDRRPGQRSTSRYSIQLDQGDDSVHWPRPGGFRPRRDSVRQTFDHRSEV